jgi:polar amino acid transport system substrate-binding protein
MLDRSAARGVSRRGLGLGAFIVADMLIASACQSTGSSPAASAGASAAPSAGGSESTFDRIKRDKVVRVGFVNEAPFAYSESGTGILTGEAPEVLRTIMKKAGVETLEGVLTEFASLIPALNAGRIDIIGAGMFIRPARCEQADFGDPEYEIGEGLAVKAGNPKGLTKLQDFVDKKAKMGLVTGGAEVEYSDIAGIPKDQQVLFPDGPTAIAGLQGGQVDAVMLTTLSIHDLVDKAGDPNLAFQEMSEQPKDKDGNPALGWGAMAFRQGDDDLRNWYNTELAALKSSNALLPIMAPFGFTETEMTTKKAVEVCPNIK